MVDAAFKAQKEFVMKASRAKEPPQVSNIRLKLNKNKYPEIRHFFIFYSSNNGKQFYVVLCIFHLIVI